MEHETHTVDLGIGWRLVRIVGAGWGGWYNLVPDDPNSSNRPALLSPEASAAIMRLVVKNIKASEPGAKPEPEPEVQLELEVRSEWDWFAGQALMGLLSRRGITSKASDDLIAEEACAIADAMLKAREKEET